MPTKKELEQEIDRLDSEINSYKRIAKTYLGKLDDKECSICKEDITPYRSNYQDELFVTGCGHNFHFKCLQHWMYAQEFSEDGHCPLCRTKFNNLVFYELHVND